MLDRLKLFVGAACALFLVVAAAHWVLQRINLYRDTRTFAGAMEAFDPRGFDDRSLDGHVSKPVLVWSGTRSRVHGSQRRLPADLRATSPASIGTVVMVGKCAPRPTGWHRGSVDLFYTECEVKAFDLKHRTVRSFDIVQRGITTDGHPGHSGVVSDDDVSEVLAARIAETAK